MTGCQGLGGGIKSQDSKNKWSEYSITFRLLSHSEERHLHSNHSNLISMVLETKF